MASKVEMQSQQRPKSLVCPICFDAFKDPTLLSCGHTFCKICLEQCDWNEHLDYVECPVCRKRTRLEEDRIHGLPSNFSVKGLEDELQAKEDTSNYIFCSLHSQIYRDILCEACNEFICLNCFVDKHQGHKIKKKEEIKVDLERKRDAAILKGQKKKAELTKSLNNTEQCKLDVSTHVEKLKREIADSFSTKREVLKAQERRLLEEVDRIHFKSNAILNDSIAVLKESVGNINMSVTVLTGNTFPGKYLDTNTLVIHDLQFSDLENCLQTVGIDEKYLARVKKIAERAQFFPADEKVLELGCIEPSGEATIKYMRKLCNDEAAGNAKGLQTDCEVLDIPAVVKCDSTPAIVRKVDLSHDMSGLAALSQDSVVISYGIDRNGSDCISVSGDKKPHMEEAVGNVYALAFLSNGKSVVSHGATCCVYNTQDGSKTDVEYTVDENAHNLGLWSDQNDVIYSVGQGQMIYIFYGRNKNPFRILPTGGIFPEQIRVTNTGAIIVNTHLDEPNTLSVFDKEGHVGSSIVGTEDEDLFATVDSLDRVLVVRLKAGATLFCLTRYTLQGAKLVEPCEFRDLELPHTIPDTDWSYWCHLVSLTPDLIAFATTRCLYFMKLPM